MTENRMFSGAAKILYETKLRGKPDTPLTAALHATLGLVAVPLNWSLKGDSECISTQSYFNSTAIKAMSDEEKKRFIALTKRYYEVEAAESLPDADMRELLLLLHSYLSPSDTYGKYHRGVVEQCLNVLKLGPLPSNDLGNQLAR